MDYFAVAVITKGETLLGVNLLNLKNEKTQNVTYNKVIEYLSLGGTIRNLELVNGSIAWVQGDSSRYPYIDTGNKSEISNKDNISVIGYYVNKDKENVYLVANYLGNLVFIDEERLIQYGEKYKLTNCKIVNKGNKKYIVSLYKDLDRLDDNKMEYSYEEYTLNIRLPYSDIDTLNIPVPDQSDKYDRSVLKYINIQPSLVARGIKKIVFPKEITNLTGELITRLPNLEALEFKGNMDTLVFGAMPSYSHVKSIIIESMTSISRFINFRNMPNLIKVEIKQQPSKYKRLTFDNCPKLTIGNLLSEGLKEIQGEAFNNCNSITDIELPNSLRLLDLNAFSKCKNIKNFRVKGLVDLCSQSRKIIPLLNSTKNATVYCDYNYPIETLKKYCKEDIQIIRGKMNPLDEISYSKEKIKLAKAQVLGKSFSLYKVAIEPNQLADTIELMDEDYFREAILEIFKEEMNQNKFNNQRYKDKYRALIGKHGLYIRLLIDENYYQNSDIIFTKETKNYLGIGLKNNDTGEYRIITVPLTPKLFTEVLMINIRDNKVTVPIYRESVSIEEPIIKIPFLEVKLTDEKIVGMEVNNSKVRLKIENGYIIDLDFN